MARAPADLRIAEIELWNCVLPLAQPIDLGNFVIRQRTHLVVRMRTEDGMVADCVSQARSVPLDVIAADLLAPRLVGKSALDISARRRELQLDLTFVGLDGAVGRAWSALEICMQDLRAQCAGWPMWRLLGGHPRAVDIELVEGYDLPNESDEQFAERLAARSKEGYRYLKLEAAHYKDQGKLIRRIEGFRKLAGSDTQLVLDFAATWENPREKGALIQALAPLGIAWIEDPLPRQQIDDYVALRRSSDILIGAGDEATRAGDIRALIMAKGLDMVRLDATALGGFEAARDLTQFARDNHLKVSYHDRPEVHEHCVFGLDSADHVEVFPVDRPFDRAHDIIQARTFDRIKNGKLSPGNEPGTGLKIIEDTVTRYSNRHFTIKAA
jgi:L-alanine-DL-glutamate epimerase-like enolase superfamily enzyme